MKSEISSKIRKIGLVVALLASVGVGSVAVADNASVTLFAPAARATTVNGSDVTNFSWKGAKVVVKVTAASGTAPTLVVKIQGKDSVTAAYYDIPALVTSSQNIAGTSVMTVYPGLLASTTAKAVMVNDVLPRTWRAVATIGGGSPSITFSASASLQQ